MKNQIIPILASGVLTLSLFSCEEPKTTPRNEDKVQLEIPDNSRDAQSTENKKTKIKLAIILDTSNSMDGLIDQAKNQLWKIVTELAKTKDKNGEDPDIDLALYQYGNDNLSIRNGYVQLVQNFKGEQDEISEKLIALNHNRGGE